MFLAIKEMKFSKFRYVLVIGVMFLISYLAFILSGLATGLSDQFKQEAEDWGASQIVLSEDSNSVFAASQLKRKDLDRVDSSDKAPIGLYSGAIDVDGQDDKVNVSVFGASDNAFYLPEILEGNKLTKENQIIISQNLADKGLKVGDKVKLGNLENEVEVVGIFNKTYYAVTPVIYTNLETWTKIKYGKQPFASDGDKPINAILSKGDIKSITNNDEDSKIKEMDIPAFIQKMPGYAAQNLTLMSMIYFLFVIVAAVIGIFMYVMTIQKTSIFGVMKAQGISNGFIAKSIVWQSVLVGFIGVLVGFVLAYLTSMILPEAMPFAIDFKQWLLYGAVLILVSALGGLFSIRTVAKVDPIKAIG
ncbi:ABC transporter permease [Floricoccus tropicus]|uniref:Putative hemin transport system permease protein HrtB n=1 Tax=Floricoccus tropicus TaxID=1859473 RepID=A0A1E8GQ66_9LACT|nr:FtsX-like permease family protein [Floricoccus tropicus]OFI50379.1 ABC transporter permease [Floricoccus tropicus]